MSATEPALVVLAWGNESRADDGVGPLLARRIAALTNPRIELIEDLQLHIEHVMDLRSDVPALFIDTSIAISDGFRIESLEPRSDNSVTTHTVSPAALLRLYELTLKKTAPEAYLLHVAGRNFELGEEISAATAGHAEAAWLFLSKLLSASPAEWQPRLYSAARTPELSSGLAPVRR